MHGTKTTNIIESNHLFETKKGRLVKIALSPIPKKKIAMIPNIIGKRTEYIVSK